MTRVGLLALVFVLAVPGAWGQTPECEGRLDSGARSAPLTLASNTVSELAAAGDSLWVDPLQGVYCRPENRSGAEPDFFRVNTLESVLSGNVVSAIEARNGTARGNLVWVGLSFDTGGGEFGTNGFLVSTDGGASVDRRAAQLDEPTDTTIAYGVSTVAAVPITQQASSVPRDLAFGPDGDTVWVAGQRSGLRWTVDVPDPATALEWRRTVLPPDTSQVTDPTTPTDVLVAPPLDDGRGARNHVGFSVLVDETGTVWAGTGGGLNRSRPEDVAAGDGRRAWRRFTSAEAGKGPPGEVVVALAEQPNSGGRNPIWVAAQPGRIQEEQRRQRSGVAVTENGGKSFRQTLIGERISDLAARQARVYAVGPDGLFFSVDRGRSWQSVERFPLQDDNQALPSDVEPRSVAVTPSALWVGTTDGLLRLSRVDPDRNNQDVERDAFDDEIDLVSGDAGEAPPKWELFRAQTPVNPESPSAAVPDVSTYAYPNPFVPSEDDLVRIVYEREQAGPVTITIYDFGMNKVKTLTDRASGAGQDEAVWRGTNDRGLRVPTGTYFYRVEMGERTVDGKILVAN